MVWPNFVFSSTFQGILSPPHNPPPPRVPPAEYAVLICVAGSLGERAESVGRCTAWSTGTSGARPVAGRRPASASPTEPRGLRPSRQPTATLTPHCRLWTTLFLPSKTHRKPRKSTSRSLGGITAKKKTRSPPSLVLLRVEPRASVTCFVCVCMKRKIILPCCVSRSENCGLL